MHRAASIDIKPVHSAASATATAPDAAALRTLVRPDAVHHSVYSDPAIFKLEMTRLFGRAWLLLGHASQVKAPGDWISSRAARESVIVARHTDGSIGAFFNRCTHRGTQLCHEARGHAKQFVCPYHGWIFGTDGALKQVPVAQGYGPDAGQQFAALGLARLPRVALYRGFIFGSLAASGPALNQWLGPLASSIDDMVDRAPGGELQITGGVFKHAYDGNWKLMLENHLDGVHPNYVHASSVAASREAPDPGAPEKYADIAVRQMRQNGAPEAVWEATGIWTTDWGHGYMGDYHSDSRLVAGMNNPVFADYRQRLEAATGKPESDRILGVTRWNSILYPNVSFMSQFRQLRIVHPLAVDRTVVYTYSFAMPQAPAQMLRDTIAFSNVVNGTASWVLTDDLEVYGRVQRGLAARQPEWVSIGRGAGGDVPEPAGTLRGASGTSEIFIRQQHQAWLRYMTAEGELA